MTLLMRKERETDMSKSYTQLAARYDWESDKSVAFDLDLIRLRNGSLEHNSTSPLRIFVPRSQVIEVNGLRFISDWIVERKQEELVRKGFDEDVVESVLKDIANGDVYVEEEKRYSLNGIVAFFDTASGNLATPKILFEINGGDVKLNRAGSRSKHFGKVFVTNAEEWGSLDRKFYGSIDTDALFTPSADCTSEIHDLLKRFDADPAGVASKEGRESGNCAFCYKALTTERSRDIGYGPKCAKNYGLIY